MQEFEQKLQIELPSPSKLFTPGVILLLILMVAGWILVLYAKSIVGWLVLDPSAILHGQIWRLLSFILIESCPSILVFHGLTTLFIGSMIEREWRTPAFLLLWLTSAVVCGLIWTIVSWIAGMNWIGWGSGPCIYAVIAVFGCLFRDRKFLFFLATVRAQTLAVIFIVIGLVLSIARPISAVWVGGALVGYLCIQLKRQIRSPSPFRRLSSKGKKYGGIADID